ncbi:MAG: beta-lactamase family protein [Clostridia bacterium]|nr:beta-lactamase family protein [Clostridia bacterium]
MNFQYMKDFMDSLTNWIIPGNSIVVYKDGKEVFSYQSGYSDLENKIKMCGSELFNIYSCSKPATVTAALKLYEQGKFLLSDPLYDFIPEFRDMYVKTESGELVNAKSPITMRHLFTMTAGLTYDTTLPCYEKAQKATNGKMDTMTVIKHLAQESLDFHPGERWKYSMCHDVLAAVIEVISGKKFSDYMRENIFEPLDMKSTCYHLSDKGYEKMAQQYRCVGAVSVDIVEQQQNGTKNDGVVVNEGKENILVFGEEYESGGAGIITSLEDYAKFTAALANKGKGLNGNRILSSGTVELLRTNQLNEVQSVDFNWKQHVGYGYGLGVRTMIDRAKSGSNGSIGEFGWGGAAGATVIIDPELNLTAVYSHHMINPKEDYYQPRLRNVLYACLGD